MYEASEMNGACSRIPARRVIYSRSFRISRWRNLLAAQFSHFLQEHLAYPSLLFILFRLCPRGFWTNFILSFARATKQTESPVKILFPLSTAVTFARSPYRLEPAFPLLPVSPLSLSSLALPDCSSRTRTTLFPSRSLILFRFSSLPPSHYALSSCSSF